MEHSNSSQLVVCSVLVAPVRNRMPDMLRTWIDQIVKIVVHTFVVEESKVPLNSENPDGYWYCAGDFCNIDEPGVYQHLSHADIEYAKCLVAPNIKDNHLDREKMVISGKYNVNYVCHNITNRVLYSTEAKATLADIEILKTGYEVVVKSVLGVYGQNKVEWERRKKNCTDGVDAYFGRRDAAPQLGATDNPRNEEIHKIHLIASDGNTAKAENLTYALQDIDQKFYLQTQKLVNEFDHENTSLEVFNSNMVAACAILFSETIREVGRDIAMQIYPDCIIDLEIENTYQTDEKYIVANG